MNKRLKEALPLGKEFWPFVGSFAVALLGKLPLAAVNSAGMLIIAEKMRENDTLLYAGLIAYGLFNLLYVGYDYIILRRDGVGSSAKANTLYRVLKFLVPNNHEFNAVAAEAGALAMNVVGINPDISAPISTVASAVTGDMTFWAANRMSDMISSAPQLLYAFYLKRKGHGRNN